MVESGGEKLFEGQATFVVEYGEKISVNGREWRFDSYAVRHGEKPRPDAAVIIADPDSKDRTTIWFWISKRGVAITAKRNDAKGVLTVVGSRDGNACVDAWRLNGKYAR